MILLGLDTCTAEQSLAVARDGRLLASLRLESASRPSETLLPALGRLLSGAGISPADLAAVAATNGPGTFTGLRVGLATAKGLTLASGIPLAGFSTLRVLAEALAGIANPPPGATVCALMEAGRGQVYRGVYEVAGRSGAGWLTGARGEEGVMDPARALLGLPRGSIAGGEGLARVLDGLREGPPEGVAPLAEVPPLAETLAARASEMLARGTFPVEALAANYIRPPEARVARG